MFRTTLVVAAALLGLAFVGPARAHAGSATTSTQKTMTFEGKIISIDKPAQDFTVRSVENGTTHEMKFHVADPLEVHLHGDIVLLDELHTGDRVSVTYEESGQSHVAHTVHKNAKAASR